MLMIKLAVSLLVPWLCGYVWLALIERRFHPHSASTLRQLGYGFFLGYATLYANIHLFSALGAGLAFGPVIAIMSGLGIAGVILLFMQRQPSAGRGAGSAAIEQKTARSIFTWIFILWIAVHLFLVAIEILYQPVYPWDAWTSWIYRSRSWFYSGDLVPIVAYDSWLKDFAGTTYTIGARDYPSFASVIPLWVAITLGQWPESLVNLPVLLCGVAIGLGVYGQCRELAVPRWLSILAMYLFFSIPLVGAHLSLGGYADIWLAGYAGLGLAALLSGLVSGSGYLWLSGLAMVGFGVLVKNEGVVWFCLALFISALSARSSRALLLMALTLTLVLGMAAWITGDTLLILPGLGEMGYRDGSLVLPFVGENQLLVNDIAVSVWRNGFVQGTWQLLWFFVVLSVFALLCLRKQPGASVPVISILILLFGLYFIFGLTEQGRWAETVTAINRLPLHLVPALILCVTLCCHWLLQPADSAESSTSRRAIFSSIWPAVLATLALLGCTLFYVVKIASASSEPVPPYKLSEPQLVLGGGYFKDGVPHVNRYQQGAAIISSGELNIPADDFQILRYSIDSGESSAVDFFWRTDATAGSFALLRLDTNTLGMLTLKGHPHWRGEIREIGLMINGRDGDVFTIRELNLESGTPSLLLDAVLGDWMYFEPWGDGSINRLSIGRDNPLLSLPLLLICWSVLCMVLYWLISRRGFDRRMALVGSLSCLFIAWCLLDVRWTMNSLRQSQLSVATRSVGASNCFSAVDCRLQEFASIARENARERGDGRLLIMRFDAQDRFRSYRTKYHLLPAPAAVYHGSSPHIPWGGRTHVLVLWPLQGQRDEGKAFELVRQALSYRKLHLEIVAENSEGVLIEVRRGKGFPALDKPRASPASGIPVAQSPPHRYR